MSIRGAQTRERIKKKSLALFSQKGFKEVTMKDICEITGLSRGGPLLPLQQHRTDFPGNHR